MTINFHIPEWILWTLGVTASIPILYFVLLGVCVSWIFRRKS